MRALETGSKHICLETALLVRSAIVGGTGAAGRDLMIGESLKNLPLLYRLCPELTSLRDRIAAVLTDR